MHSNPNHLYQMLYGGISTGEIRRQHEARSNVMNRIERIAAAKAGSVPSSDQQRYGQFVDGFRDVNGLRERLATVSDTSRTSPRKWTGDIPPLNTRRIGTISCLISVCPL